MYQQLSSMANYADGVFRCSICSGVGIIVLPVPYAQTQCFHACKIPTPEGAALLALTCSAGYCSSHGEAG